MSAAKLRAVGLCKGFDDAHAGTGGSVAALRELSFSLEAGRHVCIMGPSGAGKTTLLRILAGLERADAGELWLGDTRIDLLDAAARPTRTVFQTPALFPHLSVLDNVTFADRIARRRARPEDARELLSTLGLDPERFGARNIDALSGGERQRVALARALYRAPPWLLLDEPLSALDHSRRAQLRRVLARIQRDAGLGMVHVTHEASDALALADEILCLIDGRLVAQGPPRALYERPPSFAIALLLGELSPLPPSSGGASERWIRPERIELTELSPTQAPRCSAELLSRRCVGPLWEHELRVTQLTEPVLVARPRPWEGSSTCGLTWADADILEFPP